jgi:CubicO group peptidase (beta-lactamase class C family)
MRKQTVLFTLLAVLLLTVVVSYSKIASLVQVISLFDEDKIVENFRSMNRFSSSRELTPSSNPYVYPSGPKLPLPDVFEHRGNRHSVQDFLSNSWTTGFMIVQDGYVLREDYFLGNQRSTQNISWSMAKSFISTLIGIAVNEKAIESVSDPVDRYAPMLKGSGYEGVSIKDVLQMSSGVGFNEDYGDFYSDINRWGRGFALGASQDEFATTLQRERSPGTRSQYVSIDTHVLGMVLTRSTQTSITEYMQEKLYEPLGMNHAGYWLIDGEGMEMALGGLNLTLVDFVKIGSLFLNKGKFNGQTIVPESWVESSLAGDEEHLAPTESFGYGYQWWLMPGEDREFMAMGVYGQYVYVNPRTRTVIAKLSANPFYNYDYLVSSDYAHLSLFRAISAAAVKTGMTAAESN